MSQKRPNEASSPSSPSSDQVYHTSNPIHDRSSTFLAIFSASPSLLSNPSQLQSHPSFLDATHRMLAWRRPSRQRALPFTSGESKLQNVNARQPPPNTKFETGSDEDGESYAGRKLEALLEREGVVGTVCVARWYGGVMLGPVRFKWIEDVAREAIRKKGTKGDGSSSTGVVNEGGNDAKRPKIDESQQKDETEEKERLVKILADRDASVEVLRDLLAEKNAELKTVTITFITDTTDEDGPTITTATAKAGSNGEHASDSTMSSQKSLLQRSVSPTKSGLSSSAETTTVTTAVTKKPSRPSLDYARMPLPRLKQLEKAKDASIGWILKQIDEVEIKLKEKEREAERRNAAEAEN